MAEYSRKEFFELCGISKGNLAVNIKRGKVVLNANNKIDTNVKKYPMNVDFMEKRLNGPIKSESKPKTVATKKEIKPVVLVSDESELEREERVREKYNVETRIKNADLEKKEIDLQIAKVKLAKTMGDVIPTDMVKDLFAQQFKSVTTSFHQAADNFIMDIAKRAGLKRDDIADLRGKLIEMINEGIVEAQIESKKAVRVIVKDYSEKRGVGERK
jgi:hypothetical protein